jgi:hypothetical protein
LSNNRVGDQPVGAEYLIRCTDQGRCARKNVGNYRATHFPHSVAPAVRQDPDGDLEILVSNPIGVFRHPQACSFRSPVSRSDDTTILLDAGFGPRSVEWQPERGGAVRLEGGGLPDGLAGLGISPEDVDIVLLSHLHADHSGWIWHEDGPRGLSGTPELSVTAKLSIEVVGKRLPNG